MSSLAAVSLSRSLEYSQTTSARLPAPPSSPPYHALKGLIFNIHRHKVWVSVSLAVLPMWPFSQDAGISKLIERVETLERDMRNLRLDWETTYEKIRTLMARLAKRADSLNTAHEAGQPGEGTEVLPTAELSPTFSRLTPRQKQIQQQIMVRRQNGGR